MNWTSEVGEARARTVSGELLLIAGGAPHWFCYRDGEYLGTEVDVSKAKQRSEKGEKGEYVAELDTVDDEWERLKPKPKVTWEQSREKMVHEWRATMPEEKLPARVRQMDPKTFACYRRGLYVGSEDTLERGQRRCLIGQLSHKNRTMARWEQEHRDELPPFLRLTAEERAEYWKHNPPRAGPAERRVTSRGAGPRPDEDPATTRLRAALEEAGARTAAGRAPKAAGAAEPPAAGTIRVRGSNPKKAGTGAHARWALLLDHDGKTVAAFAAAKGNMTTLANAVAKKIVEVET